MKSSIRNISTLVSMMVVAIFAFTFTSCSDEDEPVAEVTYTYGFSSMSASHPDFLAEMSKIESAFKSALGITGKPFTKKGSVEECDNQVYDACLKAFESLKGDVWQGDYIFQVTNVGTEDLVYKAIFRAENENRPPVGNKAMEYADTGDFYFYDGTFADKSTELTTDQKYACIGVVLKKGCDRSGDWADNGEYTLKGSSTPMEVHGYVLALTNTNGSYNTRGSCTWGVPWSNIVVGCDKNKTTGFNGYSNTIAIKKAADEHGWSLKREFPAAFDVVNYENTVCFAPPKTSGWFLPSAGQCQYWLNNLEIIDHNMIDAGGDGCFGLFWSSSETSDSPVSDVYLMNSCPGYNKIYSDWKIGLGKVRPCLAY